MAQCIQCPDGTWICGDGLGEPDCGRAGGRGEKYGEFTVKDATFEVYLRAHPRNEKDFVIEIRPV